MVDVNTQEQPQEDFYSSLSGLKDTIGPIADPMVRLLREKEKTTQTEMQEKAAREAAGATKKAAAARTFYDTQKQEFGKYDKLPERPKDTITQDTQQGLQGLAMLLPVAGLFLGSVGNTSGVNAMNAMTGILKGYKEGNDQRIAFETKKYESAIKEWEANYKKAKEGIDRAIEIAKTNYQAGVAEAEAAARKIGSTELAAMVRSKTLGEIQTMMNKVGQDFQTAKNKAETLAARPQRPIPSQDAEGKPIYRDPRTGEPITDAEGNVVRPAPTGRAAGRTGALGGYAQQFEDLTAIATNEAALAAQALVKAPFSNTGLFQGRNTGGLIDAPIGVLANTLTSASVQQYNVIMGNMGTNITKVLYGGRVVPVKVQEAFNNRFAVRQGDDAFSVLLKMADMRQTFERAIEVKLANPNLSPEIKEIYKKTEREFIDAIPFTMNDVLEAQAAEKTSKGKQAPKTFGDFMSKKMGGGSKPQTGAAPKKSAEQRYSELEGSGMSEAAIFKQMQDEGY